MVKAAKKTNDKFAQKLAKNTPEIFRRVLVFLGRPFYLLFLTVIVTVLFVSNLVGKVLIELTLKLSSIPSQVLKNEDLLKKHTSPFRGIRKLLKYLKFKKSWGNKKVKRVITGPNFYLIKIFILKVYLKIIRLKSKIKLPSPSVRLTKVASFLIVCLLVVSLSIFVFWQKILKDLPDARLLQTYTSDVSTKIYDRNGVLLYKIYKNENRTPISLSDIPQHVRLATIASEDAEFYSHNGFSLRGIFRSLVRNIKQGELVGGSTITQQLVKNTLLTPEKTLSRKIRELILSIRVELTFSKDQILEMYLNEVSYGGTAYGIEEASSVYFGKSASEINLSEAAVLAGLPKSPSKYSPFTDPEAALARQKEVLRLMEINKFITNEFRKEAESQKITFQQNKIDIKAPHFVMYIKELLAQKYGEEVLEKGGLEIITTLDYKIQVEAEKIVKTEVDKLKALRVGNGAAVVLNPQTGEILAMVGSKDYFDSENDGNVNVALRLRQPGSSIKLINYAYALSHGFTPATLIDDSPISFSVAGQPPYSPKNYDGAYRGQISLRSALAESRNIPAVKTLATFGVRNMIDLGKKMGITTWNDPSRYGLSLTLGGGEIKLLELAQAYATVANYGKRPEINPVLSVKNYKGKVLESNFCSARSLVEKIFQSLEVYASQTPSSNCPQEQVLDSRVSFLLTDILKDNGARSPAFGRFSQLVIPNHPEVAVKTGTSNDLRDNLAVGYSQDVLVAVWVGNNDNSPMSRVASGITGASPIWNKIMSLALAEKESVAWVKPEGIEQLSVCSLTASLPCDGCPTKSEFFLSENKPTRACSAQAIEKIENEKGPRKIQGSILTPALSYP